MAGRPSRNQRIGGVTNRCRGVTAFTKVSWMHKSRDQRSIAPAARSVFGLLLLVAYYGWFAVRAGYRDAKAQNEEYRRTRFPNTDLTANVPELDWRLLATLNLATGQAAPALDSLNNRLVRVTGFVLPFDDATNTTSSFLLVPYVGACVHAPTPPPNQLVQTDMRDAARVPVLWSSPVYVEGILHVAPVDSPYGRASFSMEGLRVINFETKREVRAR